MIVDLGAGAKEGSRRATAARREDRAPRVLVFDSGLGGLTVYPEIRRLVPHADLVYAADDAVFPYGNLPEAALIDRVLAVIGALIAAHAPDAVVIACNTASTLVLGPLRARWPDISFVGTVPAIKPAAAASTSRMISVIATPGTVARQYTRELVRTFASACDVTLVGAAGLARLAEAAMRGHPVDHANVAAEIGPAFVDAPGRRTDVVVLACTHYPLLLAVLRSVAPWPVTWIDPAAAIARRVEQVLGPWPPGVPAERMRAGLAPAVFTSNRNPGEALGQFLATKGLRWEPSRALAALTDSTAGI